MEKPEQAKQAAYRQIRMQSRSGDAERKEVAKHVGQPSRKAAIVYVVPVP